MLALRMLCRLLYIIISLFSLVLKIAATIVGKITGIIASFILFASVLIGLMSGFDSVMTYLYVAAVLIIVPAVAQFFAESISNLADKLLDV